MLRLKEFESCSVKINNFTKRLPVLLICVFLCFVFGKTAAQNTNDKRHRSAEGREFWFGFMQGCNLNGQHYLEITATSGEGANFSIFAMKSATAYNTYTVDANSSLQIKLPLNLAEPTGFDRYRKKEFTLYLISQ